MLLLYLLCCICYDGDQYFDSSSDTRNSTAAITTNLLKPIGVRALSALELNPGLFWCCFVLLLVALTLWLCVAFIVTDPGVVDTRDSDFKEVCYLVLAFIMLG